MKIEANGLNFYEKFSCSNNKNNEDSNNNLLETPIVESNKLNKTDLFKSFIKENINEREETYKQRNVSEFNLEIEQKEENQNLNLQTIEVMSCNNTKKRNSTTRMNKFKADICENYDSSKQNISKKKVTFADNQSIHTYSHDGKRRSNKELIKILKANKNKNIKSILKKTIITEDQFKKEFSDIESKNLLITNYHTNDNKNSNDLELIKENGNSDSNNEVKMSFEFK